MHYVSLWHMAILCFMLSNLDIQQGHGHDEGDEQLHETL